MTAMIFDPGRLDHRLVLEAAVETPDGAGGVTRAFAPVTTLWAEVTPLAPHGDVEADELGATLAYRVTLRAPREITTQHRFTLGGRVLRIVAVRDPDGSGRFVEVRAEERVD